MSDVFGTADLLKRRKQMLEEMDRSIETGRVTGRVAELDGEEERKRLRQKVLEELEKKNKRPFWKLW